ncbi:nuclear transport factor 2 family protein [Microbacterium sp. 2FI]|uniref:nuclear transport factor 2 family protein n=1 Tax=Microbacterium sp. 2FI TaxID=2502193 RepID=UPI0010F8D9B2|nr:nuclear transport factor 2 family protein [Microbacterium sp. 2FI]
MTNAEIIAAHYAASDAGDLDGMLAPFAADIEWTEADGFPLAGTYVGPRAVAEGVFARLQQDWDGFRADVDEVLDAGATIIGIGTYSGTNRVTGKSFAARFTHIWRLESTRVVRFEQVVDSALVVEAMSWTTR